MQYRNLTTAAVLATAAFAAAPALGQTVITGGHWDFETAYEDGTWDPHWHNHDTDTELELGDVVMTGVFDSTATGFLAGIDSPTPRPGGSAWDFTGAAAGEDLFIFPASDPQPELPYLGNAAEEIASGVFVGNQITLEFEGIVSAPAGGDYSLYQNTTTGPRAYFSSVGDSSTFADNTLQLNTGSHQHFNWAFTEVGTYQLAFNSSAVLNDGNNTFTESGTFVATFNIVPEPTSLGLLGASGLALLGRRRR